MKREFVIVFLLFQSGMMYAPKSVMDKFADAIFAQRELEMKILNKGSGNGLAIMEKLTQEVENPSQADEDKWSRSEVCINASTIST